MKKYIGKRIMISLVTLLIIILVLFMLLQLMPGSPCLLYTSDAADD